MSNQIISRFFKRHPALEGLDRIAAAVSGGPDSMALAHMLIVWAKEHKKQVHVLTVDHGLRVAAKTEAQMVADWVSAENNGDFHHQILEWRGDKPETSIMEAARAERYRLMAEYCHAHDIGALFLGHHQDDQAETFLIRLAKGSGLDGLASMSEVRAYDDDLILARPLLGMPKQELIEYCDGVNVPYVTDPSNEDDTYLRPRVRQSMAALEKEGLSSKRLAVTAKRLARARQGLEQISAKVFDDVLLSGISANSDESTEDKLGFDFIRLQEHPEEIGLRVLQKALEIMRPAADYNVRMERLEELFESLWFSSSEFKPRTLGGCIFSLKKNKEVQVKNDGYKQNMILWIEKEKG